MAVNVVGESGPGRGDFVVPIKRPEGGKRSGRDTDPAGTQRAKKSIGSGPRGSYDHGVTTLKVQFLGYFG